MTTVSGSSQPGLPLHLSAAAALGAATTLGVTSGVLPVGIVAVALIVTGLLLLPEQRRIVLAFAVGAAVTLVILAATWLTGWGCASEVDGQVVEHDCGRAPVLGYQVATP